MIQSIYTIIKQRNIAKDTYEIKLAGDTSAMTRPGQFVNLKLDGFFLRRPISVCDYADGQFTIIYKVVGRGTAAMAAMQAGEKLDVLTGLGNGYDITKSGRRPLLIGGGAGVPPMYGLAKALLAQGIRPQVILGFNTADEVFYQNEFAALFAQTGEGTQGCAKHCAQIPNAAPASSVPDEPALHIATADGSAGQKGFVTDVMAKLDYDYFFTCGPMPMFRAIEAIAKPSGQYSFEERMGCGFGACMGCSCKTKYGNKRICKDGPVLEREEIIW